MITRREYLAWSLGAGATAMAAGCAPARRRDEQPRGPVRSVDRTSGTVRPGEAKPPGSPPRSIESAAPERCPPARPCPPAPEKQLVREIAQVPAAATFEVSPTTALVWAYAPEPTRGRILLQTRATSADRGASGPFQTVATPLVELPERTGRARAIELTGLEPGRAYRYRLELGNGRATDWYRFGTAPPPDVHAGLHFVLGADISNDSRYPSATLHRMAASRADFLLSLGDWPYTDVPIRDTQVSEYRSSHRVARLAPAAQRVLRAMPMYAIYDDHEIRDNWDGAFRDEDPARLRAGLQVWDEFFPVRGAASDPMATRRYRTFSWGRNAQFFVLDTRRYRSPYRDPDGPDKTMLGADQLRWLERELVASRARFKIVATSVPLAFGTTRDHWSDYAHERDALLALIGSRRVRGVVFLSADQHWFAAHHHAGGIREFQVGPLASFLRTPPEPAAPEVVAREVVRNYGEIVVTAGRRPHLVFTARDEHGGLIYSEVLRR